MSDITPYNNHGIWSNDFDSLFDNFVGSVWGNSHKSFRMDVKENQNQYIVEAEIPGLKKEDIKINYDNDRLTITLERNEDIEEKNERYIHKERRYGSLQRSVYISGIDEEKISAKYQDGLLKIILPKSENKSKGRSINIQ